MDTLGWVYYRRASYDSAIGRVRRPASPRRPRTRRWPIISGWPTTKKGDAEQAKIELERSLRSAQASTCDEPGSPAEIK